MPKKYSKKNIYDFLKNQHIMSLSTCYKDKPDTSTMLYAIDKELNIYFATHVTSRKAKNIKKNKNISIAVWKNKILSIQAEGKATEVNVFKDQQKVLVSLAKSAVSQENFYPPVFRINEGHYVIYKAKLSYIKVLDLTSDKINEYEKPYVEIRL